MALHMCIEKISSIQIYTDYGHLQCNVVYNVSSNGWPFVVSKQLSEAAMRGRLQSHAGGREIDPQREHQVRALQLLETKEV